MHMPFHGSFLSYCGHRILIGVINFTGIKTVSINLKFYDIRAEVFFEKYLNLFLSIFIDNNSLQKQSVKL